MRRLDGASAMMIYNDVPRNYQHTLKIAILDFSESETGYQFSTLRNHIEEQLKTTPFQKWKIARVPLGLNHPYWVQDLDFDISHHVHRIACPAPGDKTAFCELVSELYAQNLDQTLPLWTVWVVEGLADNKVATVAMLHHAYTDGVGASKLLERLATSTSQSTLSPPVTGVDPNRNPSRLRLFLQGAAELPVMFLTTMPQLLRDWRTLKKLQSSYRREGRDTPPNPASAPTTALLNVPEYSHGRTFHYQSLDLAQFKAVGKSFGVTINDLLLAVVTGALKEWHLENGITFDAPLVAGIPFNMRDEDNKDEILGNHASSSTVSLPVHLEDPLTRLEHIRQSANTMKAYVEATRGIGLIRAAELFPPAFSRLMRWMVRRSKGLLTPLGTIGISNVRGPRESLYLGPDIRISDWLSIGQVSMGVGINITAWSYVDRLNICLMANKYVVPEGEPFFGYVMRAYKEYVDLQVNQRESADLS